MAVATYTKSGTKATTPAKLDKAVFGVDNISHELLKTNYLAYLANGRENLAKTKLRGDVRGGGRKPWRQKGTGRARFGSSRNPIWRGGGIVFGPTGNENYSMKISTSEKRAAIKQSLTMATKEDRIKIVETFTSMEGKTKDMASFLQKIDTKGKVLCVVSQKDLTKEHATQNIPYLKVCSAKYLNVYDIMNADTIVISKKALEIIGEWLGGSPTKTPKRSLGGQE